MNFVCDFLVEKKSLNVFDRNGQMSKLPIKMMFWVDSDWEGVWVDDYNPLSKSSCSLFRLNTHINPLPPCTLNKRSAASVIPNNCVKVQFFSDPERKTNIPDFCFMSVCPLRFFFERKSFRLGLWNYNIDSCDERGEPIPDYLLTVFNRNSITQIPSSIQIVSPSANTAKENHNRIVEMSNWINDTLEAIFPQEKTIFKVLRTYGRGPWMNTFFFDLHKLYETNEGTNLPPGMALYIVCNACLVHCMSPNKFLNLLRICSSGSEKGVENMLIVVRDIIMCFTMCQKEGKYRDDKCMGRLVEDQPFSLAFRSSKDDNVFDEDDCEGHDQHGCVHVKGLFKHIAKYVRDYGVMSLMDNISSSTECLCIRNQETMLTLLQICVKLGELFETKELDAIMSVGEANFASFSQVNTEGHSNKKHTEPDPHSFGLLLFKDLTHKRIKGSMILETTGWENRGFKKNKGAYQHSKEAISTMKEILKFSSKCKNPKSKFILRCVLNEHMEDTLYIRVFAGDDCIFFTMNKDGGLQYGASPSHIFKYAKVYAGESNEEVISWLRESGIVVLVVSPEQFLKSLCDVKSPWGRHQDAERHCKIYGVIKAMYPDFRRCLMPPQITETEFLRKMNTYWGKITDEDLQGIDVLREEGDGFENTLAISCRVENLTTGRDCSDEANQFISEISKHTAIKAHDFMHSKVFILKPDLLINSTET